MERPERMPRQITMNVTKHRIKTETAITQMCDAGTPD